MNAKPNMAATILDAAQQMAQSRGFNAFSFDDLAGAVGIRKASIFHHFHNKSDLGRDMVTLYRERFRAMLDGIDRAAITPRLKLERYVGLYRAALDDGGQLCLCTMLAADFTTLPEPVRQGVREFAADNQEWLTLILTAGRGAGELHFAGPPETQAELLLAAIEGAELVARRYGDVSRFDAIMQALLQQITPASE